MQIELVENTTFTQANPNDTENIIAIAKNTVDQCYRSFLGDQTVNSYLESGELDKYLLNNIKHTWQLNNNKNEIIGFSICIDNVIDFMLVSAKYQRKGYGSKLLEESESLLFENHHVIALESYEDNKNATIFYIANSWIITDKYTDYKSNAVKLIFRKRLLSQEEIQKQTALPINCLR